jgi:hypothetical protein
MREPRVIIKAQGLKIGLESLTAIASYLGYKNERNFLNRVRSKYFNQVELQQMFDRLYFSDEDILNFFGREKCEKPLKKSARLKA